MTLYAKDGAVSLIRSMIQRGRLPHAFIIFGEKGVGKRTLAREMASEILCERGSGEPCGKCSACMKLSRDIHPDFIAKTPSGKSGNYLTEDLRNIISDASVTPSEGDKKIYFLPSIDKALPEAQNMLLKIVEEPPRHVMFIMTAESKERILPTILSRVISIGITEPSEDECLSALIENGVAREEAERAVAVFGGNIGRCMEYIENGGEVEYLQAVKAIVGAMIERDEFKMAAVMSELDSPKQGKALILDVLASLKTVFRDISAEKLGAGLCSVCRDEAKILAGRIRQSAVEKMFDAVTEAERKIGGNANALLTLSDLCGKLSIYL